MALKSNFSEKGRYGYGGGVVDLDARLGWWERKIFPKSPTDLTVVIEGKYVKRPDLLSYDVYGTSHLQWLVLQYNNIIDINVEFVDGNVVQLPAKSRVFTEILNKHSQALSKY